MNASKSKMQVLDQVIKRARKIGAAAAIPELEDQAVFISRSRLELMLSWNRDKFYYWMSSECEVYGGAYIEYNY